MPHDGIPFKREHVLASPGRG